MDILDYKLVCEDGSTIDLPHLTVETVVKVWEVPTNYRANGLFVSVNKRGEPVEIPACDHGDPVFEQVLPASPVAVLAEVKAKKNADINEWRLAANQSTFSYQGKQFACDVLSRSDIDGVANSINLTGQFPAGFPNAWKAVDNTYLPVASAKDFISFYQAMTSQGAANFARAQQLKAELSAATTVEQVENIVW